MLFLPVCLGQKACFASSRKVHILEISIFPLPVSWVMAGLLLQVLAVSDAMWPRARPARCVARCFLLWHLLLLCEELQWVGTDGVAEP